MLCESWCGAASGNARHRHNRPTKKNRIDTFSATTSQDRAASQRRNCASSLRHFRLWRALLSCSTHGLHGQAALKKTEAAVVQFAEQQIKERNASCLKKNTQPETYLDNYKKRHAEGWRPVVCQLSAQPPLLLLCNACARHTLQSSWSSSIALEVTAVDALSSDLSEWPPSLAFRRVLWSFRRPLCQSPDQVSPWALV
mmetsp:Transcript_42580/g.112364  ORF Transcript_42580/g.112364 Transcript_42580/m.112364 type:complete len:198 (-) Transcript_42580:707-1300(-)